MNNTRTISNIVYSNIMASGLLGGLRRMVFDYICEHAPTTIAEAIRDNPTKRDSSINARFSELRRMDLIEQVGVVRDPTGGAHQISQWSPTGRLPIPLSKKKQDNCPECDRLREYLDIAWDALRYYASTSPDPLTAVEALERIK